MKKAREKLFISSRLCREAEDGFQAQSFQRASFNIKGTVAFFEKKAPQKSKRGFLFRQTHSSACLVRMYTPPRSGRRFSSTEFSACLVCEHFRREAGSSRNDLHFVHDLTRRVMICAASRRVICACGASDVYIAAKRHIMIVELPLCGGRRPPSLPTTPEQDRGRFFVPEARVRFGQ